MTPASEDTEPETPGGLERAGALYRLHPGGSVVDEMFHVVITQRDLRHPARRRLPSRASELNDLGDLAELVVASDSFDGGRLEFPIEHEDRLVSLVEFLDGPRGFGSPAIPSLRSRRSPRDCAICCWLRSPRRT